MSKSTFTKTVKRGNVRVKIYLTPSNGCEAYTVAYCFGGKRIRKTFSRDAAAFAGGVKAGASRGKPGRDLRTNNRRGSPTVGPNCC
jgi:hypothetical protein